MSAAGTNLSCGQKAPRFRALVVDDSQPSLAALCSYVERDKEFAVVDTAMDGCEALQHARSSHPDLVVIDVEMPRLNGIDATRALLAEFPRLPVVIVSLHDSCELRELCQQVGAQAFVSKGELGQVLPAILQEIYRTLAK